MEGTYNAFAILGLRALYIVLAQALTRIQYLHYGLAGVLGFADLRFITADWIELPPLASIAIIVLLIGASTTLNFTKQRQVSAERSKEKHLWHFQPILNVI